MFEGTFTAIVTPFDRNGKVDYVRFRELIEFQIAGGVSGLVPVGTTGESPTLNYEEHQKVIEAAITHAKGRVKIIAGTGANSTDEAVALTRHAKDAGADATLQVTPYYNKPNREGLIRHFSAVADLGLPVILYNVPGRTGKEIPVDVVVELSRHPHVAGIKEAAGSADRVSQIFSQCDLDVLSGDDGLTLPMMVLGAKGVISVASNIIPAEVSRMVNAALGGRWEEARRLHYQYYRVFSDLFLDTNPVPVKAALAMMGRIEETYRLPLCEMPEALRLKLKQTLSAAGIL
ncbi:MAG TPA: 4-hydroxy-tetrahydrodipicolinate synthase [Kiritimatiellia bacterium]|nr:4-hydroxy-tetrahydrodipicolinate synthase [Kiritimatiellia bacterium]HMO99964.1 4-hydroxy-tetrahydrodipicolinate synthase [Kiritimatiellia bacterium]HMP97026.1 4-hydroxy-tetrahydrodipicolinate synthase [Kiritimatiellia bacterium]